MKRKCLLEDVTFWNLFWFWMAVVLVCALINTHFVHHWLMSSLARSGLGITLLLWPVYPPQFEMRWTPEKSRQIIRLAAAGSILIAFLIRFEG